MAATLNLRHYPYNAPTCAIRTSYTNYYDAVVSTIYLLESRLPRVRHGERANFKMYPIRSSRGRHFIRTRLLASRHARANTALSHNHDHLVAITRSESRLSSPQSTLPNAKPRLATGLRNAQLLIIERLTVVQRIGGNEVTTIVV